jgi:hypothetical protein
MPALTRYPECLPPDRHRPFLNWFTGQTGWLQYRASKTSATRSRMQSVFGSIRPSHAERAAPVQMIAGQMIRAARLLKPCNSRDTEDMGVRMKPLSTGRGHGFRGFTTKWTRIENGPSF